MLKFDNLEIKIAKSFKDRLIGLMLKKDINCGLLFKHCRSIHTFFMLEEIDVVAADNHDNVIKTYKRVKPWKVIIAPRGTKMIYELPKGTIN